MVSVRVPATTANIGPAFDCLGIALSLYNQIEAEVISEGLIIEVTGRDSQYIERDQNNLVYKSMKKYFDKVGEYPSGLYIRQHNEIPVARGLGSSAASIVGGVTLANKLMGNSLSQNELLELAVEIEGHPDNVAPALLGGVVVSNKGKAGIDTVQFPVNESLRFYAAIPDTALSTELARGVLPQMVSHRDAVFNVGNATLLVAALMAGELDKIEGCLQDRLHQPYRFTLMPSLDKIFLEAEKCNIKSLFLSGAGPTIILLEWKSDTKLQKLQQILKELPEKWQIVELSGHNQC